MGREIVYKDSVGSTNGVAFDLALAGCGEGVCVIAEAQESRAGQAPQGVAFPSRQEYLRVVRA